MNKRMAVSLMIGLLISGAAMYFSFRNIPFGNLLAYLKTIEYLWLLPAIVLVMASYAARAARWRILAVPVARLGFWESYHFTMIGFMLNCVLPARIGEMVRPAALKKKYGAPFTAGFATVVVERIFDIAFLVAFMVVCLATVDISPDFSMKYDKYILNRETLESIASGMTKICVMAMAVIFAVCFEKSRNVISVIIQAFPKTAGFAGERAVRIIRKYASTPADNILHNVTSGFEAVKNPVMMGSCLLLSFLVWVLQAASYYVFALGCPGFNLGFFEISAVMVIICFIIALPSVPGFWGIWEAGSIFAVTVFGIGRESAAGYSIANHALQMFPVIVAGIFSALIIGFGTKNIEETEVMSEEN